MAAPFVYTQSSPLQYPTQLQPTPYYFTPQSGSPFIPELSLYHISPYSNPVSLPGTPGIQTVPLSAPLPASVPFPTTNVPGFTGADIPWAPFPRERRPSWHATVGDGGQWLQAPPVFPVGMGTSRRHSFGAVGYQPPPLFAANQTYGSLSEFHINPWLNAESPRGDFHFDLASTLFSPIRHYGPGQVAALRQEELVQPATHPPITKLRIVCDLIPQWPIELQPNAYMAGAAAVPNPNPFYSGMPGAAIYQIPPISLLDVLLNIHRSVHKNISHSDWARLSEAEEVAVARAYTARCKAVPSTAEHELAKGVKRVDFLLGKTKLVGLVRMGQADGWQMMKLYVR